MPPPRPRGVGFNTGVSSARPSVTAPMSERQQMALLIQMTSSTSAEASRTHLKKNEPKKFDEIEEENLSQKEEFSDNHKEKLSMDENISQNKKDNHSDFICISNTSIPNPGKRQFSDVDEEDDDDADDLKKKKRKEIDSNKDSKVITNVRLSGRTEKYVKQTGKTSLNFNKNNLSSEKEISENTNSNSRKDFENETEDDESKINENVYNGGLKVPPLKIVIPQQNCSIDVEGNISRPGKINTLRNSALPYVVSSSNDSNERDFNIQCNSPQGSPVKVNSGTNIDEKIKILNEDKNLHRVLRSSNKAGLSSIERSSNNSSPQMQSSLSPASINPSDSGDVLKSFTNAISSPTQQSANFENENINLPSPSTSSTSSSKDTNQNIVELHPRKRKIRSRNDDNSLKTNPVNTTLTEISSSVLDAHPHDFPFLNCFQMFLNIRKQIEKKWKNMYSVKPRPPQGYNDYLINRRSYLLFGREKVPIVTIPSNISTKMRDIFLIQEKERSDLYQRHVVEREKLCLNVEQEIIRVHSKAARNISCQSVPYSVCTFLKDEEVYNAITPEQEEKERNARYRFNGRLLLGWLQDVDDKWEKIKDSMLLRHHNEAESLHAVQVMDWEIALKKYQLCDIKCQLIIEKEHVPIVHVHDDFDLLPV